MSAGPDADAAADPVARPRARPTYWLTRFLILRLLGFVYFFAFLSLARQVLPLIGHDGLLPADLYLERVLAALGWERGTQAGRPTTGR